MMAQHNVIIIFFWRRNQKHTDDKERNQALLCEPTQLSTLIDTGLRKQLSKSRTKGYRGLCVTVCVKRQER